jgi:tRNA threonylcarbamoyladenosine modification (KEOPS) complex  Pcc1 subunit
MYFLLALERMSISGERPEDFSALRALVASSLRVLIDAIEAEQMLALIQFDEL